MIKHLVMILTKHVWYWLVLLITMAVVVAVFTIPAGQYLLGFVRQILGAIFLLFIPGFAFTQMLLPSYRYSFDFWNLDKLGRAGLSIGLSIALVALTGLVCNYTPWGIRLTPVTLSLATLTLTFATIAKLREHYLLRTKNEQTL